MSHFTGGVHLLGNHLSRDEHIYLVTQSFNRHHQSIAAGRKSRDSAISYYHLYSDLIDGFEHKFLGSPKWKASSKKSGRLLHPGDESNMPGSPPLKGDRNNKALNVKTFATPDGKRVTLYSRHGVDAVPRSTSQLQSDKNDCDDVLVHHDCDDVHDCDGIKEPDDSCDDVHQSSPTADNFRALAHLDHHEDDDEDIYHYIHERGSVEPLCVQFL